MTFIKNPLNWYVVGYRPVGTKGLDDADFMDVLANNIGQAEKVAAETVPDGMEIISAARQGTMADYEAYLAMVENGEVWDMDDQATPMFPLQT